MPTTQEITQYLESLGLPTQNLPVQPGLDAWQLVMQMAIQKYMADLQEKQALRTSETQLGASPSSFVAYELFKRGLEKSGKTPFTGASLSDQQIQQGYNQALGFGPGSSAQGSTARSASNRTQLGTGQFGVPIYNPGEIGRSDLLNMSEGEQQLLSSFLQAGVKQGNNYTSIDPSDYMQQVKKGFIPSMSEAGPQVRYG